MTNREAVNELKCYHREDGTVPEEIVLAIKALERDGTLSYDEIITSVFSCPVCGAVWRKGVEE